MDIGSIWAFMANWSTPTILFCVLNLMIVIIFIASNHNHNNHSSPSQLTRSPSFLERVKSMNMSSFYTTTQEPHDEYYRSHFDTNEYNSVSQVSRPPSLLQRVKSIEFSFSSFYNSVPIESEQVSHSTSELTRAPSFLDRVKSFKLGPSKDTSSSQDEHSNMVTHHDSVEDHNIITDKSHFNKLPSFLDRVKSFKLGLSMDTSSSQDEHSIMDTHHDSVEDHIVISDTSHYNKLPNLSEKEKSIVTLKKRLPNKLSKSSSEKRDAASDDGEEDVNLRRPATMKASVGARDECVDAKADDFIKRFKQQLKLQRIDSLQRFREMLNRGTSSA